MSRTGALILLGVLIVLVPFSGLPIAVRTLLTVIFGASIAGIGLALRARETRNVRSSTEAPPASPPPNGISPI